MFKAQSYLGYKLCWPGDLVINSLWAWAGGLGVSRYHGIISSAYGVYRVRPEVPMIPAYLHEVVRSSIVQLGASGSVERSLDFSSATNRYFFS